MSEPQSVSRRAVLAGAMGVSVAGLLPATRVFSSWSRADTPRFGLVTYQWGRDLELQPLLRTCAAAGVGGVELRTTHAHGVEPSLSREQRTEIREDLTASGVELVGLGSDERFDSPDPERVRAAIEATKRFLQLSHDLGGGGVKVKPDTFHDNVPRERTIEQIARSLREVGETASDLDQEVRLEVHGGCREPAVIRAIMEATALPSVRVCWNCNPADLKSPGFDENFRMLRPFFGQTLHVRELDGTDYPYRHLVSCLLATDWAGWVLLEAHSSPGAIDRRVADLEGQREQFDELVREVRRTKSTDQLVLRVHRTEEGIQVLVGDDLLAATHRTDHGPVLYPVHVPGVGRVVRGHPMETHEGEATDHPHHRSLWLAHGDVDGHDFWHDPNCRVQLVSEDVLLTDCEEVQIRWKAEWKVGEEVVLEEDRTMRFTATEDNARIEFDITLAPPAGSVTFGDTKEGFFAIRLAPSLKVEGGSMARGRLGNQEGLAGRAVWGKRSAQVFAEGPIEGRLVRVSLSDDPRNVRFPTWWHARTYGLVTANPFGTRAFEGVEAPEGSMTITAEQPLRLRYQVDLTAL